MTGIYLLLGTNIGNRQKQLDTAINKLENDKIFIVHKSSVYESAAWGKEDQQDFLNQVIEVDTSYSPHDLLRIILNIEKEMGRERIEKWAERVIDIDILFYHNQIIATENLNIPHPYIAERRFTLEPLNEIASHKTHPILNSTIEAILANCLDPLSVQKI